MMLEIAVGVLILMGGGLAAVAGLGLVRMPDVMVRMHASTKVGTLAPGLLLVAVALFHQDLGVTVRAVAIFLFLLLTAPIAAHMIGRAALRMGVPLYHPDNRTPDRLAQPDQHVKPPPREEVEASDPPT